jgi:hypothetical protein
MRELRNGPIAVNRGRTRRCKREENADRQRLNNVSKTGLVIIGHAERQAAGKSACPRLYSLATALA